MRYAARGALLAVILGIGACTSGARTDEFTAADTDAIRKRSQQLPTAFNAKQLDAIVELYAENSVFMPPNAPLLRGREPLLSSSTGNSSARTSNLRLETDDVAGHGPLAYETGTYWLNPPGRRGARPRQIRLRLAQDGRHLAYREDDLEQRPAVRSFGEAQVGPPDTSAPSPALPVR